MATKYALTDAHRLQLAPWAQRWIDIAMRTRPMDDDDRSVMRAAVRGLYQAAGLTPPPDQRIVFVPSPFVARFAGGFAAAIWYLRRNNKLAATRDATAAATAAATGAATRDATEAATWDATRDATWDATRDATWDATRAATWDATRDATEAATAAATWDATGAATGAATRDATRDATAAATEAATWAATGAAREWYAITGDMRAVADGCLPGAADFALACAQSALSMWNGGNQWAGWVSFLSFFRHVAQLPLDYDQWAHYEQAAICGGPRVMHADFCIVSDFPRVLTVDANRRPHHDSGPFCAWADGSRLYAWHGTRVPGWIIEHPERITVEHIQQEANAEIRRVLLERFGADRYVRESGAQVVDADEIGTLYRVEFADDEPLVMVSVLNSTPEMDGSRKTYLLRVPPTITTAREAVAWTFDVPAAQYLPAVET